MAYLFKHKNGIYKIAYRENGRLKRISTGTRSKAEANQFYKSFNPKKRSQIDLEKLKAESLQYAQINTKPEMFRQYKTVWNNFISFTGNKNLSDITNWNIKNYIKHRQETLSPKNIPYSPCSINLEIAVIKKSFTIAVENNWLESNPAGKIKKLPVAYRVPEFTIDEVYSVLNELHGEIKDAVIIAINTGMRRGEVANLKWQQIDLISREIHLQNKITKKAEFVAINDTVFEILNRQVKNIDKVFTFRAEYLYRSVKKAVKKLGLNPKLRFHSLRHTYITCAVNKYGIHIGQELARHSSITMTAKYYHSRRDEIKAKAMGMEI